MAFLQTLRDLRAGGLIDDLDEAIRELVAAVTDEGKGGKLVLTLTVKKAGPKQEALMVEDAIKLTLPKQTVGATIFYATVDNDLQRDDPRQSRLELREVPRVQPREIGPSSSAANALA